jgi:hypothetical protein
MVEKVELSERRTSRLVELSRSALHYEVKPDHGAKRCRHDWSNRRMNAP